LANLAAASQSQQQPVSAFTSANPQLAALTSMSPAALQLLNSAQSTQSGGGGNPLAQLLLAQSNPQVAQQQQLIQRLMAGGAGNQGNLMAVLNVLQTNPLLASQLLLQQQQQQQPNVALLNQLMGQNAAATNRITDSESLMNE
jgi:hypothetical protein